MAGEADKDVTLLYKEAQHFWASRRLDEMDDERFAAYVSSLSEKVYPNAVALPSVSVMAGDLDTQAYLLISRDDANGGGGEEAAFAGGFTPAELGLSPFELPEGRYAEIELLSGEDIALVYKRLLDDIALLGCVPGEYFVEFFPRDDEPSQCSSTLISVEIIMS